MKSAAVNVGWKVVIPASVHFWWVMAVRWSLTLSSAGGGLCNLAIASVGDVDVLMV